MKLHICGDVITKMKYFSCLTTNDKRSRKTSWRKTGMQPPWRNRLARSAVNRKVGGSSPPGGGTTFFKFI
jgi:hypothetical protein